MAEKISGLLALGSIALLLCFFIPSTAYILHRAVVQRLRGGYRGLDLVSALLMIITLGVMFSVVRNAQQIYPRCGQSSVTSQMAPCLVDRYDDTGPTANVTQEQAAVLMRADLLSDFSECVIVPSAFGIAALLVFKRILVGFQKKSAVRTD